MLMKVNTTKQVMRTAIELLQDINPSINNFAYNRSLTASPFCPCNETEETATHFLFDCTIYEATNRPAKNFNLYDLRDCVNLIEFIRTSGRFDLLQHLITDKCKLISTRYCFFGTKHARMKGALYTCMRDGRYVPMRADSERDVTQIPTNREISQGEYSGHLMTPK